MGVEMKEFKVTYTGIEANTVFFEPVFMDKDILSMFRVMPNVVHKKKMQFVGKLEKIVRKYTGCGFKPIGGISVYDRCVEVDKMKIDLQICIDEFLDTVFEQLLKKGTRIADLSGTLIQQMLMERVREALKMDMIRLYFFGDRSSADPSYDPMDGIWTVHIPSLVSSNLVPYFNTGSGMALNAGDGIEILKTIYDNQPLALKCLPASQKRFYVSGSVWMQYMEDLEDNGSGCCDGRTDMINGVETLYFRGIQLCPMWMWDETMEKDFGSPDAHLCLLTTPNNLVVATDIVNGGEDFVVWYDEKDEHLYIKSRWKMGGNYVHNSLFSVGY